MDMWLLIRESFALLVTTSAAKRHGSTVLLVRDHPFAWSHIVAAKLLAIPYVLEINAPFVEEAETYRRRMPLRAVAHMLARAGMWRSAACVFVSEELAVSLSSRYGWRGRALVVPNGVDPSDFFPRTDDERAALRRRLGFSTSDVLVVFSGSMRPWHGVEQLLQAFGRTTSTNLKLVLVGGELDSFDPRIRCISRLAPSELSVLLGCADVGVLPYPPIEGFYFSPLKLFEYLASGLAVVGSRIGQVEAVLKDVPSAKLVPAGDIEALAGVLELFAEDGVSEASRQDSVRAGMQYTWTANARSIVGGIRDAIVESPL